MTNKQNVFSIIIISYLLGVRLEALYGTFKKMGEPSPVRYHNLVALINRMLNLQLKGGCVKPTRYNQWQCLTRRVKRVTSDLAKLARVSRRRTSWRHLSEA